MGLKTKGERLSSITLMPTASTLLIWTLPACSNERRGKGRGANFEERGASHSRQSCGNLQGAPSMSHPLHVHHLRPGRHLPSLPASLHTHGPPLGCQLCWIGSCIIPQPLSAPFLPSAAALSSLMHFFLPENLLCLFLFTPHHLHAYIWVALVWLFPLS